MGAIPGVGDLKVFPAWQGGGTVLLSIVDTEYLPVTPQFAQTVKDITDPEEYTGQGVGTAPIGHSVTVMTPTERVVDVSFPAILEAVTPGQVQADVERRIGEYLASARMGWADSTTTWVYASRIVETVLRVQGIVSVSNITLNGSAEDISFKDTAEEQFLPVLGGVVPI